MLKKIAYYTLTCCVVLLTACEGINCTLNNVVLCHIGFYDSSSGEAISLTDTLTITAAGTDSVLVNMSVGTSSLSLPMSYWNKADSLKFSITGTDYQLTEIVYIEKSNTAHYESPDCPTTMFHELTSVNWEQGNTSIDSIVIVKPSVNYQTDENIRIYFYTGS